ncbi:MAG: hypothetical protein D6688_10225 [Alphaproteobacteria bacterium]|nr:MAG: hypothetical protein D6688_10225 [Alphaproteobacteria bacterium]
MYLAALVGRIEAEARRRADRRRDVEARWLDDLRQYHGVYDDATLSRIRATEGSAVFVNETMPRTDRFAAKLEDILLPADTRGWTIRPTPDPELDERLNELQGTIADALAGEDADGLPEDERAQYRSLREMAEAEADELADKQRAAQAAADLMARKIDDVLIESDYKAAVRAAIADAARIGIGVLKGPVLSHKPRRRWVQVDGGYALIEDREPRPAVMRVDPWQYYPDPDGAGGGTYERHLMGPRELRKMAREPGVNREAIIAILGQKPRDALPQHVTDLASLTGTQQYVQGDRLYTVWEYTGYLDIEDIKALAVAAGADDVMETMDEEDPANLFDVPIRLWTCQGHVLRIALHPLDSHDDLYSTFSPHPDEASPYGYGIPYLLRDTQAALNAAWRKLMDNSAYSVAPQIIVNKGMVSPEDGKWTITAGKVWSLKGADIAAPNVPPFSAVHIPGHIAELQAMIEMVRQEMDRVVDVQSLQESDLGTMPTQTASGIAMLLTSANVTYRSAAQSFDDQVTRPIVRRLYDWMMQFDDDPGAKGDYLIDARGAQSALAREVLAQNLMTLAANFGDHPAYGNLVRHEALLRMLLRAIGIPSDEILKTAEERSREEQPDPAMMQVEMQREQMQQEAAFRERQLQIMEEELNVRRDTAMSNVQIAQINADARVQVARMAYEEEMMKLAEQLNMSQEQRQAMIEGLREKIASEERRIAAKVASDERKLAAEATMAMRLGRSAGGSV